MYVLDGQWYMEGLDWDDEGCIHSSDELLAVIESVGFLPLFSSGVPGFSVEEMTDTSCWWSGDVSVDPWEWRAVLARTGKVAYGKFYGGRAGFISKNGFHILQITGATATTSTLFMKTAKQATSSSG